MKLIEKTMQIHMEAEKSGNLKCIPRFVGKYTNKLTPDAKEITNTLHSDVISCE